MVKSYTIIDAQFGSTGKGLIAGYLAVERQPDTVVCAWSPNAGHTFIAADGRKFVHCMLPNGVVSPRLRTVLIGPGALIDPVLFAHELDSIKDLMKGVTLAIHEHAGVCMPRHAQQEKAIGLSKIGSTTKGVMAAQFDRMRRDTANPMVAKFQLANTELGQYVVPGYVYQSLLEAADMTQIEGAQGFSLSMYHGFYPYVTSRDVSVNQIFADCAIPTRWHRDNEVIATLRTYPIRVNNRDGSSGPGYEDQTELEWSDIGVEPELTTVTKLPRRVFTFSLEQLMHADTLLQPDAWFLNFCNYVKDPRQLEHMQHQIENMTGTPILWTGWGPTVNDVREEV